MFAIIQVTREYPQGQEQSNYKENHSLINLFEAMMCEVKSSEWYRVYKKAFHITTSSMLSRKKLLSVYIF